MRMEIRDDRRTASPLPLLLVGLLAHGLCAQVDVDDGNRDGNPPVPINRAFQTIQEPEDPSQVRGSFHLAGEKRIVTEGDFYETYLLLKPHLEKPQRPLQPAQVLEHVLLFAEAESLGLAPTPEEVERLNPAKSSPTFADQIRSRWEQQGITEAEFERYVKESRAIQRLKSWFSNTVRVTSRQVFDLWKRENYLYEVDAVVFHGAPEGNREPTEEELREFWTSNSSVQELYRTPTTITAHLMVFDPSQIDEAEIDRLREERPVDREAALAYFQANKERLMAQIPSSERPKLYPPEGEKIPVAELVTPFQLLEESIEREILIGDRIARAFDAVGRKDDGAAWKAAAEASGLEYRFVDAMTREAFVSAHEDLGPQLWRELFGAGNGQSSESIDFQNRLRYFWFMVEREDASLPNFGEVKDQIVADWRRETAWQAALERANEFLARLDAHADEELVEEFAQIDADARQRAEDDIAQRNITDERMKKQTRTRFETFAENQKRAQRAEVRGKYFAQVADELGLELGTYGPFAFDVTRMEGADPENPTKEEIEDFLASSYQLRTLQVDQVTPLLTDSVLRCHAVGLVKSRTEPDFEDMPDIEYYKRRMQLERQNAFQATYQWTGYAARNRLGWTEGQ